MEKLQIICLDGTCLETEEGGSNVQADWNQTDSTKDDFIKNKPTNATQGKDGFMSKEDKKKLDDITPGEYLTCETLSSCFGHFTGVTDKTIYVGDTFDPRAGVVAYDKNGNSIPFVVVGDVDTSSDGTYLVAYIAEGVFPAIRAITVELSGWAYAYIDSSNNEMHFFRDDEGKYTDGQVVGTKTYYATVENQNQSTYSPAWNGDTNKGAVVKVVFDDTIKPLNTSRWFYRFSSVASIDNINKLRTSNDTKMYGMFAECRLLASLDVSGFDTSNVTSMETMFSGCSSLTFLDVSRFNTSKVTTMANMFFECSSLNNLDTSNFDTREVKSMASMFSSCSSLTSLDVSNFNTSKVTSMVKMFLSCSALTSLDVSNFDTAKVTSMESMFNGCSSLTTIDVSRFNTRRVTAISSMFNSCENVTALDLSNFVIPQYMVSTFAFMFSNCKKIKALDLSGFNTTESSTFSSMFRNCSALETIFASENFTVKSSASSLQMFTGCSALVGGAGTVYSGSYTNGTRAKIDGGSSAPGYFTAKP